MKCLKTESYNELLKKYLDNESKSINSKLTWWNSIYVTSQILECFRKISKTGVKPSLLRETKCIMNKIVNSHAALMMKVMSYLFPQANK